MKERHPCEFYIDGYVEIKTKYDKLVQKIYKEWEKLKNQPEPFQYKDLQRMNDKIELLKYLLDDEK